MTQRILYAFLAICSELLLQPGGALTVRVPRHRFSNRLLKRDAPYPHLLHRHRRHFHPNDEGTYPTIRWQKDDDCQLWDEERLWDAKPSIIWETEPEAVDAAHDHREPSFPWRPRPHKEIVMEKNVYHPEPFAQQRGPEFEDHASKTDKEEFDMVLLLTTGNGTVNNGTSTATTTGPPCGAEGEGEGEEEGGCQSKPAESYTEAAPAAEEQCEESKPADSCCEETAATDDSGCCESEKPDEGGCTDGGDEGCCQETEAEPACSQEEEDSCKAEEAACDKGGGCCKAKAGGCKKDCTSCGCGG